MDQSVEQSIIDLVGKIGEKIEISDYKALSGEKNSSLYSCWKQIGCFSFSKKCC